MAVQLTKRSFLRILVLRRSDDASKAVHSSSVSFPLNASLRRNLPRNSVGLSGSKFFGNHTTPRGRRFDAPNLTRRLPVMRRIEFSSAWCSFGSLLEYPLNCYCNSPRRTEPLRSRLKKLQFVATYFAPAFK